MRQQLPPIQDMGCKVRTSTGGWINQQDLAEHNARQQQADKEHLHQMRKQAEAAPKGGCPFSGAANPICTGEKCALYLDGQCALAQRPAAKDTRGLACPLTHSRCSESCALFCGGCTLTSLFDNKGE